MTDRATAYGVGSPRINLAPVPQEINKILINFKDTNFKVGQLFWQIPTQSFVIYNGHGVWVSLGGPGSPLQTINNVAPFPANNIDLISQAGNGAISFAAPGSGGAGTIGLTVNVDGTTIVRVGDILSAGPSLTNPIQEITVDGTSGAGTNPVLPVGTPGNVTITGAAAVPGANPVQTISTAANSFQVQVQRAADTLATDTTSQGVASFDSGSFSVDSNGWVQLKGQLSLTATSPAGAAPQLALFTIPSVYVANGSSVGVQVLFVGRRQAAPNESAYGEFLSGYRVDGGGTVTVSPIFDWTSLGDVSTVPTMGLSSPGLNQVTFVMSDQSGSGPIDWRANITLTIIP